MTGIASGRPQLAGLDPELIEETLEARPPELRVFISSEMRSGDLAKHRKAAVSAIEGGRLGVGYRAWHWERDANAGPYSSEDVCLRKARTSEFLVLIIGTNLTDITRAEYSEAKRIGAHCCIFLLQGVDRDPEVSIFVEEEREHATTKSFKTLTELRTAIVQSVMEASSRSHRLEVLRRRALISGTGRGGDVGDSSVLPLPAAAHHLNTNHMGNPR